MTSRTSPPSQDEPGTPRLPNPSPDQRGTLSEKLEEAVRAREAMSPVDRALHDSDQRRSFVRGQCGRDPGPDVLAEEVRRLRAEITRLSAERNCLNAIATETYARLRGERDEERARAERAEAERDALKARLQLSADNFEIILARATKYEAELSALKARVAEVLGALRPFAEFADTIDPDSSDNEEFDYGAGLKGGHSLFVDDFRRAAELHATLSGEVK